MKINWIDVKEKLPVIKKDCWRNMNEFYVVEHPILGIQPAVFIRVEKFEEDDSNGFWSPIYPFLEIDNEKSVCQNFLSETHEFKKLEGVKKWALVSL